MGVKERSDLGDYLGSGLNTWVEGYFCIEQCNYEDTGGIDLFFAPGRYTESLHLYISFKYLGDQIFSDNCDLQVKSVHCSFLYPTCPALDCYLGSQ